MFPQAVIPMQYSNLGVSQASQTADTSVNKLIYLRDVRSPLNVANVVISQTSKETNQKLQTQTQRLEIHTTSHLSIQNTLSLVFLPLPSSGDSEQIPISSTFHPTTTCAQKQISPVCPPQVNEIKVQNDVILKTLVMQLWWERRRQKELEVADGSLHRDVKRT